MSTTRGTWRRTVATTTTPAVVFIPRKVGEVKLYAAEAHLVAFGTTYAAPTTTLADHVFTLETTGGPTGGTFTLKFDGLETGTIAFNAAAATVVTALNALANIDSGDFVGAGGALPTAVTLTGGGVYDATDLTGLLVPGTVSTLTGGTNPSVQVRSTTVGGVSTYSYFEAESQEQFGLGDLAHATPGAGAARYLYLASVGASGTVRVSGYRG